MTCDRLDEFLDGELSDRDAAEFKAHLAGCGECSKAAAELEKLNAALKRAGDGEPPASLLECVIVRTKLEPYFDSELSEVDTLRVRLHLAACVACAKEIGDLQKLEGLLHRAPAGVPSAGFERRVTSLARPTSSWRSILPLSAAAAVLFALVVVQVMKPSPSYDFEAALRDFTSTDAPARAKAVAWIQGQGHAIERPLVAALSDLSVERQKAAGLLIASLDAAMRTRILGQQALLNRDYDEDMGLPYDFNAALRDCAAPGGMARARATEWVTAQGRSLDGVLLKALSDASIEKQRAAGIMIANLDEDARQRILGAQTHVRDWELQDIGNDLTDVELVGYALQLAKSEKTADEAIRILKKLDKEGVNRAAHDAIVKGLKDLFSSGQEPSIRAGFRIVERLELLMEDVVEFLDVPDLGDRALEFLKKETGKDFGHDKDAWRRYFKSTDTL